MSQALDVNDGTADELLARLVGVPQLARKTRERIITLRPFASFEDMVQRVNHTFSATDRNRLTKKMAKHLCVREYKRARDAAYGREIVGLNVHVPWSAWENYEDGSGYDTATVVEYQSKLRPPRFKVAFPSYLEYDDLSLSWEEVLAEKPCLNSNGEKAQLVTPRPYDSLTPPPRARAPPKSYWDMREAAWYDYDGQKRVPRIDERTPQPSRIHCPYACPWYFTLNSKQRCDRAHTCTKMQTPTDPPTLSQFHNYNTGCWVAGLRIMSSYTTNPPPVHLHG